MSQILQVLLVIFVVSMATISALALGRIVGKRDYSQGFKEGGKAKEEEVYKKRLLRQQKRTSARAEEVKDVTSSPERRDGSLQGSDLGSDSEPERSESSLFSDHADASGDSTAERVGGQGLSEVDGSSDPA